MNKKKKRQVLVVVVLMVLVGGGWFFRGPLLGLIDKQKSLAAGEVLERCYALNTGDKLHYRFKAKEMLSFDIRRGGDTMMPPRLVPFDEADFVADDKGEYCLRFGNPLTSAQTFEYRVNRIK